MPDTSMHADPLEEIYRIAGRTAYDEVVYQLDGERVVSVHNDDVRAVGKAIIDAINPALSKYLGEVLNAAVFGGVLGGS